MVRILAAAAALVLLSAPVAFADLAPDKPKEDDKGGCVAAPPAAALPLAFGLITVVGLRRRR